MEITPKFRHDGFSWVCESDDGSIGTGDSRENAYLAWMSALANGNYLDPYDQTDNDYERNPNY